MEIVEQACSVSLAQVSSLAEKQEFVAMVSVQQMVRATCLEVMGAPPTQLAEYRREVLELQSLIRGFHHEVEALKALQEVALPLAPGSPAAGSETAGSLLSEETVTSDGAFVLQPRWQEVPPTQWYEGRPIPRFAVVMDGAGGSSFEGLRLRASLRNGRGDVEESKANGSGPLVGGERFATVVGGCAAWEGMVVCEASSKHYGAFTLCVDAPAPPGGARVLELASAPMQVQVGRMWSKRRKAEDEISPDDSINQIPGVRAPAPPRPRHPARACSLFHPRAESPRHCPPERAFPETNLATLPPVVSQVGARYVARLQLQGVASIGQFAAMAGTAEGRATLCRLCSSIVEMEVAVLARPSLDTIGASGCV